MYHLKYACISHSGKCRKKNEDNYCCFGEIRDVDKSVEEINGEVRIGEPAAAAVFDGLGGEECGEIASYIAAKKLADFHWGHNLIEDLKKYCSEANDEICSYMKDRQISSMGTTAAILCFGKKEVFLCNIGDSKIFLFSGNCLEQISVDHIIDGTLIIKGPLTQNLGISSDDMIISPFFSRGAVNAGDVFLLCSDGLTDEISVDEIEKVLKNTDILDLAEKTEQLLKLALDAGGRDNITIILCKIEKQYS